MERRKNTRLALCGLAAFGLTCVGPALPAAYAGTTTWTGAGSSNSWGFASNWSGGAPPATGDDVFFTGSAAITQLISLLNTSYSLNSLTFNPGSSAQSFTITAGGANNVLSIGAGGIVNNTNLGQTIDASVSLTANSFFNSAASNSYLLFDSSNSSNGISMNGHSLNVAGGGNIQLISVLTGVGSGSTLTKAGSGALSLTSAGNSIDGNVYVNAGNFYINSYIQNFGYYGSLSNVSSV